MADVQILLRFPCTVLGDLKQCIENLCDLNCFLMIIRNSFWVDLGTPEWRDGEGEWGGGRADFVVGTF
jgi:hypothetical protein